MQNGYGPAGARRFRAITSAALVVGALLVAACGGDDGGSNGAGGGTTQGGTTGAPGSGGPTTGAPAAGVVERPGGQGYQDGEPRQGGEIVVGVESIFFPTDPANSSVGGVPGRAVYSALVDVADDGKSFEGLLAESVESDPTYTSWTLHLRPGVVFSDGTPLDADAVVFNFDRLRDPATKYPYLGNLAVISSYEAVDPETVRFTLTRPFPAFPTLLMPGAGSGMMASPKALQEKGADFGRAPVGAGPYVLESWNENRIVVNRNPLYWDSPRPYVDKVTFVTSLDSQAELAAIETGDIDIALTQSEQDWKRAESSGIKVLRQVSFTPTATVFNTEKPPFDDVRVRRAFKLAIDEEAIVQTVFDGQRAVATGPLTPNHPYYHEVEGYPTYDPDEAKRLIDEYEAEHGPIRVALDNWDPPEFQQMFTIIQQMWTAVGAEVELRPLGQAELVATALEGRFVFQTRYNSTPWRIVPDTGLYGSFHSKGGQNLSRIKDPEMDAAIDAALATGDFEERQEQFGIVQQRLTDLLPYLYHNIQGQAFYLSDAIKGFPGAEVSGGTTFRIELVWV